MSHAGEHVPVLFARLDEASATTLFMHVILEVWVGVSHRAHDEHMALRVNDGHGGSTELVKGLFLSHSQFVIETHLHGVRVWVNDSRAVDGRVIGRRIRIVLLV